MFSPKFTRWRPRPNQQHREAERDEGSVRRSAASKRAYGGGFAPLLLFFHAGSVPFCPSACCQRGHCKGALTKNQMPMPRCWMSQPPRTEREMSGLCKVPSLWFSVTVTLNGPRQISVRRCGLRVGLRDSRFFLPSFLAGSREARSPRSEPPLQPLGALNKPTALVVIQPSAHASPSSWEKGDAGSEGARGMPLALMPSGLCAGSPVSSHGWDSSHAALSLSPQPGS